MTDRVWVRFKGEGSGVEPLSWGQHTLWDAMERRKTWLPIGGVSELPPGTTVEQVADQLQFWMNRNQTMRTRLRFEPSGPHQVVFAEGEISLAVVDAGDEEDPGKVAERVKDDYWYADFDYVDEWPVRMAVVRHRGTPSHLVLVMCHLVTDATGAQVMFADLARRDPVTGEAATPPPAMQPLEQARWQRSPAGRRQNAAAIRYIDNVARTMPARRFGDSTDPRQPRYWQLSFVSPATHLAVRAITARTGSPSGTIMLAAFSIALARVSGTNPAAAHVLASNRFRSQFANVVGPHSQGALFMVDVADAGFDEVLARTKQRAMAAYKYAYYDPYDKKGMEERISRERGELIDVGAFFNDRRIQENAAPMSTGDEDQPPTPDQVKAALAQTTLRCLTQKDGAYEMLFVHINDVPDTIDITAEIDTHHISPADLERLLREIEEIAVAAAFDGAAPTRVPS